MSVAPREIFIKINIVLRGDEAMNAAAELWHAAELAGGRVSIRMGVVSRHDATPMPDKFDDDDKGAS